MYNLFTQRRQFSSVAEKVSKQTYFYNIGVFAISLLILILSARTLVGSVEVIGVIMNIPLILVGIVVVALGTSLPELTFELTAIKEGRKDMVLGDIMGSVVTNSALVVGVTALINPIETIELSIVNTSLIFTAIVIFFVFWFARNDGKFSFKEGVILIFVYILFTISELVVNLL